MAWMTEHKLFAIPSTCGIFVVEITEKESLNKPHLNLSFNCKSWNCMEYVLIIYIDFRCWNEMYILWTELNYLNFDYFNLDMLLLFLILI